MVDCIGLYRKDLSVCVFNLRTVSRSAAELSTPIGAFIVCALMQ